MDRMNPAERALQELFQEVGPEQAPSHLQARILARLAGEAEVRTAPAPLLRRWQWTLFGLAILGSILVALVLPGEASSTGWMALFLDRLPDMSGISGTLRTTFIGGTLITGILYALDALLHHRMGPARV